MLQTRISHREKGTIVLVDDSYFFVPKDQNEEIKEDVYNEKFINGDDNESCN